MAGTAGSVAPVFRNGGYDDTVIYDFYHALIHNNKLYFCRQDGTIGHEPQEESDEYWFLSLDGNFGDAKKLGGETAAQWQTKIDVEKERIDQIVAMGEGTGGNVESEVLDMRIGVDGVTYGSAGTAVRTQIANVNTKMDTEIAELKSDLSEKTDKLGVNNVTPYNLQGFEPTGNLLSYCELIEGKYLSWTNVSGKLETSFDENTGYTTYILAVEKNTDYSIQLPRSYALLEGDKSTIIGGKPVEVASGNPTISSGEASYIAFSRANTSVGNPCIVKGTTLTDEDGIIIPEWLSIHTQNRKYQNMTFNGSTVVASDKVCSLKSGIISFSGTFDSFTQLDIVLTTQDRTQGTVLRLNVTPTGIGLLLNGNLIRGEDHGLSITDTLNVKFEWFYDGTVKVMLYTTNGRKAFTYEGAYIGSWYFPFIYLGGTNAVAKTSFTSHELRKPTYVFGDSYLSYGGDRWGKYVDEMSTNALVNAYAGETSEKAYRDLETVLAMGIPKYLVWCLGMNDGSDTDENTPSANWVTYRDKVIEKTKEIGCELIFATIPTVPNINHEGKNAWIRNSGYRYIDFAQAVGASANGTWYDGLLSSDNVHPTGSGAVVLGGRVLTDFPELAVIY